MSRSSTVPSSQEGRAGLYEIMLEHSKEIRWYVHSPSLVSTSMIPPTREQLIADVMLIPTIVCHREDGVIRREPPHYPTRAEAERFVGRYGLGAAPQQEQPQQVKEPQHDDQEQAEMELA